MYAYPLNDPKNDPRPPGPQLEMPGEEVQEILGHMPGWPLRWGITLIAAIVVMLLLGSWLIKYPDAIDARMVLTTRTPPASLMARAEGALKFYVKDNQAVRAGDYVAVLENAARTEDVRTLAERLKQLEPALYRPGTALPAGVLPDNLVVGELQSAYASLLGSLRDYIRWQALVSHDKQIAALQRRIGQYERLNEQLEKQQRLMEQELELAQKRFAVDQQLFREKVLAEADFDRARNAFLQTRRAFEAAQGGIINNQIAISQLQAQRTELDVDKVETEARLRNAVETHFKLLESNLHQWRQRYLLQTPIAGRVAFVKYRSDNQFVKAGEEVVTVVPHAGAMYGQVQMPVAGSGKVAVGQRVNIRFDNYPFAEYGMVAGRVAAISPVPRDDLYTIRIQLPDGLNTSYRKKLAFRQEMQGDAQIITRDLRLLDRIFNQLRSLLDTTTGTG